MKPDLICCRTPYSGVNVPDHDMTFQSLSELLQQSVSPFVVSVQAKECGGERSFALAFSTRTYGIADISTSMYPYFSTEASDEESLGEVNGHCCHCGR